MPQDVANLPITSRKNDEGAVSSGKASHGTGRYRCAEYVPGGRIVTERNEAYRGDEPERARLTLGSACATS